MTEEEEVDPIAALIAGKDPREELTARGLPRNDDSGPSGVGAGGFVIPVELLSKTPATVPSDMWAKIEKLLFSYEDDYKPPWQKYVVGDKPKRHVDKPKKGHLRVPFVGGPCHGCVHTMPAETTSYCVAVHTPSILSITDPAAYDDYKIENYNRMSAVWKTTNTIQPTAFIYPKENEFVFFYNGVLDHTVTHHFEDAIAIARQAGWRYQEAVPPGKGT